MKISEHFFLSEHFTLEEFCFSGAAQRLGLDNTPTPAIIENLKRVAAALERVRACLGGKPILVHSGYRSSQLNLAVRGVPTSAHCQGLACDFICPAFGAPIEVAQAILKSDVEYDQLILEYGWVHFALAQTGSPPRLEALTKRSPQAPYESGIRA